jgi:3-oxoadipate enol-lactonase
MIHMATAAVNGITIGYDDDGDRDGRPVLLVHGHPFNRTMWAPQTAEFAAPGAGFRVITADLRGYGESTVVPGTTYLEDFARDLAALLDHLGVGQVVIGGLSMGGQIVMEFYRLFPERVSGMLLADTFPRAETPEGKIVRRDMGARLRREGMDGYTDEVIAKMVAPSTIAEQPAVAEHVLGMMRSTSPEGAAAAVVGRGERPDYCDLLTTVTVPALVVVGRDDTFTPVSDAEEMHALLPDSTLVVVEHSAHMPNLEQVTEFNTALRTYLDSLPAQQA